MQYSSSELVYAREGIKCDVRIDGRECGDSRPVVVECDVFPQANGSARVSVPPLGTDVLAAVKADIVEVDPTRPNQGSIEASADLGAGAAAALSQRDGKAAIAELTAKLQQTLCAPGAFDLNGLCIAKGKYAWRIFVDVTVLQASDNLADAAVLAAFAALQRTRLPRLQLSAVSAADGFVDAEDEEWEAAVAGNAASGSGDSAASKSAPGDAERGFEAAVDVEIEIVDDVDASVPLHTLCAAEGGPVSVTFAVVEGRLVVDPLLQEAAGAESEVRVSVCRDGRVVAVSGGAASGSVSAAESSGAGAEAAARGSRSSGPAREEEGASGAGVRSGDTEPLAVHLTEEAVATAKRLAPALFAAVDKGIEAATRRATALLKADEQLMRDMAVKYGDLEPEVLWEADAVKAAAPA